VGRHFINNAYTPFFSFHLDSFSTSLYPFHYAYISFSCIGVWQNDRVKIIAIDQGNRTTPYVSFSDNERLIGDAAKNQVAMNPHNTYDYPFLSLCSHLIFELY
jgi:hypothetical protein